MAGLQYVPLHVLIMPMDSLAEEDVLAWNAEYVWVLGTVSFSTTF